MSTLFSRIQTDTTDALKKRESGKVQVLRMLSSSLKYKEIEAKKPLTDDEVIAAIRKQVKELTEAKEQFETAGRADLAADNVMQIEILKQYLPTEMSDEEVVRLVRGFVESNKDAYTANPRAFTGKVVAALKSKVAPDRIAKVYNSL